MDSGVEMKEGHWNRGIPPEGNKSVFDRPGVYHDYSGRLASTNPNSHLPATLRRTKKKARLKEPGQTP